MTIIRTYSDLEKLGSFEARFEYLKLGGEVGIATFGFDRHLNQTFYASREWQHVRYFVLDRDGGCDLGIVDRPIHLNPMIHHMNPITAEDIVHGEEWILDPEYLITTTHTTHNAIHYGRDIKSPKVALERRPGDTRLW